MSIVRITERSMMRALKPAQFTLLYVGNRTDALKILWAPRRHYTSSSNRKCKFAQVRSNVEPGSKQSFKFASNWSCFYVILFLVGLLFRCCLKLSKIRYDCGCCFQICFRPSIQHPVNKRWVNDNVCLFDKVQYLKISAV